MLFVNPVLHLTCWWPKLIIISQHITCFVEWHTPHSIIHLL